MDSPSLIQPWHVLSLGFFCFLPTIAVALAVGLFYTFRRRRES